MKQRKSPVALVTVAVLAGVGLVIAAKPFGRARLSMEEQMQIAQKEAQDAAMAKAAAESKTSKPAADVGAEAKAAIASAKSGVAKRPGRPGKEEGPTDPTILLPEDKVYKPVVNEASTSSQWYDNK